METRPRVVEMVWEDLTPRDILTPGAFRQRHRRRYGDRRIDQRHHSPGRLGATRAASSLRLPVFDEISRHVPVLANIRPSGEFLMEDFYYAGGLRALNGAKSRTCCTLIAFTVNGKTVGENLEGARINNPEVIRAARESADAKPAAR